MRVRCGVQQLLQEGRLGRLKSCVHFDRTLVERNEKCGEGMNVHYACSLRLT